MPIASDRITRAAALRSGAGIVGGAAMVWGAPPARAAPAADDREAIVVLETLIPMERRLAAAYGAAASTGALRDLAGEGPAHLRDQELRHEEALRAALARLGAQQLELRNEPPPLDPSAGEREIAQELLELESSIISAYLDAHQALRGGRLIETLTRIMANEGQHLALLRLAVNRMPVPRALETGDRDS